MNYYIEELRIKNRVLYIEGWILDVKGNIDIIDKNNGKTYELNIYKKELCDYLGMSNKKFGFKYKIPLKSNKILIKLKTDDKVLDTIRLNNDIINRFIIKVKKIQSLINKSVKVIVKNPKILFSKKLLGKYKKVFFDKYYEKNVDNTLNPFDKKDYIEWIIKNEIVENKKQLNIYKYNPKISFILPVYNPIIEELEECINSIVNQTYKNYEICIVDDCSTNRNVKTYLEKIKKEYSFIKVKYHDKNMHISKTSNDAIEMANGEFIALIDQDDTIARNALEECIEVLNNNKELDFIYTDYDKLDQKGLRCDPYFKPDFAPDTLLSFNYLSHFNVIRKSIVEQVGGFDHNLVGAQDYDLYLKITEQTNKIYHISKILYHWRMSTNSTSGKKSKKDYAFYNGKKAIENALKRRKIDAVVETKRNSSFYTVNYCYNEEPKISIIIPTRDYSNILKKCVDSILERTTYNNYEILIVDNGSKENSTLKLFEYYKNNYDFIKVLKIDCEFNYSYINNEAVKECDGEFIVLLNNDTEIISGNWLKNMVGYAMQTHIGAVGAKLLYPDNTIQHGGVVLGLGGVASHSFIGEPRNYKAFNGLLEVPTNYAAVTAACLMIEKKKYLQLNGLDEKLKVAYNDVDFNIRLLENGYYNVFLPQIELYHHESKSRGLDTTGEKYNRFLKESKIMYDKWDKYLKNDPFYNVNYSLKAAYRLEKKVGVRQNEE